MYIDGCQKCITEIRWLTIVNRHRPPRLHNALPPTGDYAINTYHTSPNRHCRSSGEAANDRQPSSNIACLACIV